jgi:transcriptional regulator with XRE-family HTH domain
MVNPLAIEIRAKKLAVLLKDARRAAGRSKAECAQILGLSKRAYNAYEQGRRSPSLPELETLSYFLQIPLTHFWGRKAISESDNGQVMAEKVDLVIAVRQRIIGVLLRKARTEADLSLAELGQQVGVSARKLSQYELGERPIPLPEMEAIVNELGLSLVQFFDTRTLVGNWSREQRAIRQFLDLPPELREFICKPVNQPFLELEKRLSELYL